MKFKFLFLLFLSHLFATLPGPDLLTEEEWMTMEAFSKGIVVSAKKIELIEFPGAFNPSIIKVKDKILLSFRYLPNPTSEPWISWIGLVELDEQFQPKDPPQILDTRPYTPSIPSQSEDARLFAYKDKVYLIYNDNEEILSPTNTQRRDMFIAELIYSRGGYSVDIPVKLKHSTKYPQQLWQKNWVPFEWKGKLLLTYTVHPHEILEADLETGICEPLHESKTHFPWSLGKQRGSTPPILIDGEYFSFFHSALVTSSPVSNGHDIWHYFMGAYTFSPEPPFAIKTLTPMAITSPEFYRYSPYEKRVIFPGGCLVTDQFIHVALGRDDCEMWIATIDRKCLRDHMWSFGAP